MFVSPSVNDDKPIWVHMVFLRMAMCPDVRISRNSQQFTSTTRSPHVFRDTSLILPVWLPNITRPPEEARCQLKTVYIYYLLFEIYTIPKDTLYTRNKIDSFLKFRYTYVYICVCNNLLTVHQCNYHSRFISHRTCLKYLAPTLGIFNY